MTLPPATNTADVATADPTSPVTASASTPTGLDTAQARAEQVLGTPAAPVTLTEHAHAVADELRRAWTPPDVWRTGLPPLQEVWQHALFGEHLPDDPRLRKLAQAEAALRLPVLALLYWAAWVFRRGSRVLVAALLTLAIVLFLI